MALHRIVLGLGSNTRQTYHIRLVQQQLRAALGDICFTRTLWTVPIGVRSPLYLNGLAEARTALDYDELLRLTKQIEQSIGRTEADRRAHVVRADIDILLYDRLHLLEPGLQIPHPHMRERDFVMQPLREILGDYPL